MAREEKVYVDMMVDALKRKQGILEDLYQQTKQQEILLKDEDMDMDAFQSIVEEKGVGIEKLNQLDEGFDALFRRVEKEIKARREEYKKEIECMQGLIEKVSGLAVQIQALEHQNAGHFKVYIANQKKKVKEFHMNQRTANNYYQNMANAHKPEQSYFFDETK